MTVFTPLRTGWWQPSALASGPFSGLQGGAVAALLTSEVENAATTRGWGSAVGVTACFLRPTPSRPLEIRITPLREGGRVSFIDASLWPEGEEAPSATARVTLMAEKAFDLPLAEIDRTKPVDPTQFQVRESKAAHGGPWFMDAMEARLGDAGTAWFKLTMPITGKDGQLTSILGPADWAHGVSRPLQNVVADPNPNLTVQLFRPCEGDWIGVRPRTWWNPKTGIGIGHGALLDVYGEIGSVSMSVALTAFPAKPQKAAS